MQSGKWVAKFQV